MGSQPVLLLFLKALVAARKSLNLYPVGSEMAAAWIQRLHRSLEDFFQQGLAFPIRVGRDRFTWSGDDLLATDPAIETFRFDLEMRGIAAFSIEPAVEDWELRTFLELLNTAPVDLGSIAGATAYLRDKSVIHVSVETPGTGPSDEAAAWDPNWSALQTGKDEVELFVEAVLEKVDERFAELTYDRTGLARWLTAVTDGDAVDPVYTALKMLASMAESGGDREIRNRTLVEAVLSLPGTMLRPLLTDRLLPLAGTDLVAFNLLTQVTDDELGEIARLVPQEQLLALTNELLEFPWEQGKRQRLVEAIAAAVQRSQEPEPGAPPEVRSKSDPLLVELRQEIVASCHPDTLIERSADILLALIFNVETEEYPAFAVDAIEEIVGEALARGKLDLAVRALTALGASSELGGARMREHAHHLDLFRQRVAGRTHVSLVAGLLRQTTGAGQVSLAADYLRLVPQAGAEEFTGLLVDERDRRVRGRMCQVLAKVGPPAVPVLLKWLHDERWFVVRNMVHVLGRIGHASTFGAVIAVLDHAHARVRLEVLRAAVTIGPGAAAGPLIRCVTDPDPSVRREAVKALGVLRSDEAVPTLRDLVARRTGAADDLEFRQEAIAALAAIASPFARAALSKLAGRRVWFWQRREKRLRALVTRALTSGDGGGGGGVEVTEDDDA